MSVPSPKRLRMTDTVKVALGACCLIVSLVTAAKGCFINPVVDRIIVGGHERAVCEHNGLQYFSGRTFKTADCFECRCDEAFGLLCCGYGKNRQRIDFVGAEMCDIIEDKCELYVVRKDDHTRDCYTNLPVDIDEGENSSSLDSMLKWLLSSQ